jgi:hypothetical protein
MTQKTKNYLSAIYTTTLTTNVSMANLKQQDPHTLADQLYNLYNLNVMWSQLKSLQNGGGGGGGGGSSSVLVTLTILFLYIILWIYLKGWGKSQKSPQLR